MKKANLRIQLLCAGALVIGGVALASTHSLEALERVQQAVPAGHWEGQENANTSCTLTTTWSKDVQGQPVLNVTATSKYRSNDLNMPERTWNVSYRADQELSVEDYEMGDGRQLNLSSAELLSNAEDDEVYLYKIFRVDLDANGTVVGASVNFAEVNQHSDPSEDSVICSFRK